MADMDGAHRGELPLLTGKNYTQTSVFEPANLLREARRQRGLPERPVPRVCLLDPDGDIARHLEASGAGRRHLGWACYHTEMWTTEFDGLELGIVGMAVGAPFAVLVAEQLAASGAELLVSVTSAGQLAPLPASPCFVLIDRALRDEGTSTHYLPPATWSRLATPLRERLIDRHAGKLATLTPPIVTGSSWTTDAPYRETETAIARAATAKAVCVEMEAAALYAYAEATGRAVVCLAHVTNTMATAGDDFEKGTDNGVHDALATVRAIVAAVDEPAC
jgi:uridine phosphorylase